MENVLGLQQIVLGDRHGKGYPRHSFLVSTVVLFRQSTASIIVHVAHM